MKKERLQKIYRKTDGYCHICHRKLSFSNYSKSGAKGSWHIEHSVSKASGGSDHLNNLFPACISCNLEKGTRNTKTARAWHGNTRAPYSKGKKQGLKSNNMAAGAFWGGLLGSALGPGGAVFGAGLGAALANETTPRK